MKKHEAEKLIDTIRGFIELVDGPLGTGEKAAPRPAAGKEGMKFAVQPPAGGNGRAPEPFDEEALYQRFRARFIDEATIDPTLVHLMMTQPEIIVGYERKVEELDGSSLRGRIAGLLADGFLDEPRTNGNVTSELKRIGTEPNSGNVSRAIADLISSRFLTRVGADKYQRAPGVKVTKKSIETT